MLEGSKDIQVNSEFQQIMLRGIIRTVDLSPANVVTSTQIAQLEMKVNGKGIMGDAIQRPNFLYRFFLGLIAFLTKYMKSILSAFLCFRDAGRFAA